MSREPNSQHPARSGQVVQQAESQTWSGGDWFLALLLSAVLLWVYQPAWHGKPIWDDDAHLTRPELRSWAGLGRIWFETRATQQYYPVTHSAFWLQHWLWGDWYPGYHLVNLFLHGLSALLLVRIFRRLGVRGAWLAAALWALHPVQVESVAWMTELKNTLSGVCYLGTALLYLRFDCERSRKVYLTAIGLFILGLLAKSVIATLPAALLLVFYWKRGKLFWRKDVQPLIPFFAVGIACGLFTAWVERTMIIGSDGSDYRFSLLERSMIAGRAFWFYLGKLIWPAKLIFIYPRWKVSAVVWWQFLFPVMALGLVALLVWRRKEWGRGPLVAVLYFAGTLFPALGFLNIYPFRYSFVADHFQYLASIGPLVFMAATITKGFDSRVKKIHWSYPAFCLALLAVLASLTWKQCAIYADGETLYRTTIARNPECWMALNNLGAARLEQGRIQEAIAQFREALQINPANAEARNNLGNAMLQEGRTEEAITQYREALRINPAHPMAHYNLANALLRQGRKEEAIAEFRQALHTNPSYVDAHVNLAAVLLGIGRGEEALAHTRKALELQPANVEIQNNLAWILATAPQASLRNGALALEIALKANRASGGGDPVTLDTLAAAYAETKHFAEALQTARKALQLAEAKAKTELADALRREIKLYEAGQPFRDRQ